MTRLQTIHQTAQTELKNHAGNELWMEQKCETNTAQTSGKEREVPEAHLGSLSLLGLRPVWLVPVWPSPTVVLLSLRVGPASNSRDATHIMQTASE